jgi:hypothetical protein
MSKTIETLYRIFNDHYIETSHDTINEPKEGMSREIYNHGIADEDILICRLDQEGNPRVSEPFPYIKGDSAHSGLPGMKRISDYVMFVDKEGKLFVLLFELKKGKDSPQEQLDVTAPLIDFIFNRAKILKHLDVEYEVRKIGITDEVGKRSTADRGEVVYNDNNFVKLYKNKRIYLQRLLH